MSGRAAGGSSYGNDNCYYGKDAAQSIVGSNNCYYGSHAGDDVVAAGNNAAYGWESGREFEGDGNSFFGLSSGRGGGLATLQGNNNSFFGIYSGRGDGIGGSPPTSLNNSGAFGANAKVNLDNKIIIGTNIGTNNEHVNVGIGLSDDQVYGGPRSELELNTDPAMSVSGTTGSGLQFRQLISTSPLNINTYISPYGKVLTVDGNGVVKLTDQERYVGFGDCTAGGFSVGYDLGMTLNDKKLYFEGQGFSGNDFDMYNAIGIGYPCSTGLPGKLSVDQTYTSDVDHYTLAGYFHNGDQASNAGNDFGKIGLWAASDGYFKGDEGLDLVNIGGDFTATNSEIFNIGVRGRSGVSTSGGDPTTFGQYGYGGFFTAMGSDGYNIGVFAATNGYAYANYGIYASAPAGTCTTGTCYDAAGYFNGDIYTTGSQLWTSSDQNLKDNIQPLQNSLAIINQLNPKTYTFRTNQFKNMNLPSGQQQGLIAQEVQSILPNLVKPFIAVPIIDSLGNLDTTGCSDPHFAISYLGLIPYLIGAVKEQKSIIDSLKTNLMQVQSQINQCCGTTGSLLRFGNDNNRNGSVIDVTLTDVTTIILNQNTPNPFSEETFINYTVPKEVSKAIIMIYDNSGQVLKTVTISERGEGSLHVYSEKLSSGIYSYSLIADGKTIDTKQMVCQK